MNLLYLSGWRGLQATKGRAFLGDTVVTTERLTPNRPSTPDLPTPFMPSVLDLAVVHRRLLGTRELLNERLRIESRSFRRPEMSGRVSLFRTAAS